MKSSVEEQRLFYLQELYRLDLYVIQWLRTELDLLEVDVLEVNAADTTVPGSSVVDLKSVLIGSCSHLSGTWKSFRHICSSVLTADRDVEIVQDMKGLYDSIEPSRPCWSSSLKEGSTHKT